MNFDALGKFELMNYDNIGDMYVSKRKVTKEMP